MQMNSMVITELSQLDKNKTYTYKDYLLWQFQERVELIKGKLFPMSPAPNVAHQRIAINLTGIFWQFFKNKPCQVFSAPFDVRLPVPSKKGNPTTVVQPDLCVICDPTKLDEQGCNGAPDLVIEVLSPGNSRREMHEKFQVYEESGVKEYWLVYPLDKNVIVYILNPDGQFIGLRPIIEGQVLHSTLFPDLIVDLGELFLQV